MSEAASSARAWIDGAARGNPGEAGFGVVFETASGTEEIAGFLGRTTNNVAEYIGLLAALGKAERAGVERLEIFSDSQLVVRQLEGAYRVKAAHLVPIFLRVMALRRKIPSFSIRHVRREENKPADGLANRAIDERIPPPDWLEIPS